MLVLVGIRHFPCGTARQAGEKKRAQGEEEWRGEGRGRGRLKHERWWGDAREEGGGDSCRAITVVEVQTSREFERRPVAVRASYASRHGCIVSRDTEVKTRTRIIFIT